MYLVSKVHTWIINFHCMRDCSPHYGSHPSIFLPLKAIYYPRILTIHRLCLSIFIVITWIDSCILQIGKKLLGTQKNYSQPPIAEPFVSISLSPYSQYFPPNVSTVEITSTAISFSNKPIVDFYFFGNFLVKYEIYFSARSKFIEGYIATASIE